MSHMWSKQDCYSGNNEQPALDCGVYKLQREVGSSKLNCSLWKMKRGAEIRKVEQQRLNPVVPVDLKLYKIRKRPSSKKAVRRVDTAGSDKYSLCGVFLY